MIGELIEERTRSFVEPVPVKLKVSDFGPDLFGNEIGIEATLDDWSAHGVIPSYAFDEDECSARGVATGMRGDMVLVVFPPIQGGRTTLAVPETLLTRLEPQEPGA